MGENYKTAVVRLSDHAVVKIKWDEENHTGEISVTDEVNNTVYEFEPVQN